MELYKNFKFRIKWDNNYVAGASKVSGLQKSALIEHREGGDPSSSRPKPGQAGYQPVTFEAGVINDSAFEQWCNKVWDNNSIKDSRKDITIEVYNDAGKLVLAYSVFRCWVSEYQAMPELDSNSNAVVIQSIKLENEGWERIYMVKEK